LGEISAIALDLCSTSCLSICLATSSKNYRSDLHENFTIDVSVDKEKLIKFWKSPASGSGSKSFFESSALRHKLFFSEKLIECT